MAFVVAPDLRTIPFNAFIIHLALCDFVIGSLIQPVRLILDNSIVSYNIPSSYFIPFYMVGDLCLFMSIFTVILIGIDRLKMIINPLSYNSNQSAKRNHLYTLITWFIRAMFASMYYILSEVLKPLKLSGNDQDVLTYTLIISWYQLIFNTTIPLLTMLIVDITFAVTLKRQFFVFKSREERNEELKLNMRDEKRRKSVSSDPTDSSTKIVSIKRRRTLLGITLIIPTTSNIKSNYGNIQVRHLCISEYSYQKRVIRNAATKLFAYVAGFLICGFPYYGSLLWEVLF